MPQPSIPHHHRYPTFTIRLSREERARLERLATTRGEALGATVKAAIRALEGAINPG